MLGLERSCVVHAEPLSPVYGGSSPKISPAGMVRVDKDRRGRRSGGRMTRSLLVRVKSRTVTEAVGAFLAGLFSTALLMNAADWLVARLGSIELASWESLASIIAVFVPLAIVVASAVVLRKSRRIASFSAGFMVFGSLCGYAFGLYLVSQNIFGLRASEGPPGATAYLSRATPGPLDGANDSDMPLTRFTADYLNRHHPRYAYKDTVFLDGHVASTAQNEISVMPLTENKWGAVAQSSRTGRCFAIVIERDADDPQFGNTLFGTGPDDEPCVASLLSEGKITFDDWDDP